MVAFFGLKHHNEHLRELCDRTIEQGNRGAYGNSRVGANEALAVACFTL